MTEKLERRQFLMATAAGGALCWTMPRFLAAAGQPKPPSIISPGCRTSKVRVGKVYLGRPNAPWPTPGMDIREEMQKYEAEFARMKDELADVEFLGNQLVTTPEGARNLEDTLKDADGILLIHLSMGALGMVQEIVKLGRPTVLFAAPYSGHEWTRFGGLRKTEEGALLECMLTSELSQLAVAVRPFRAIHHLREAKILNVTTRNLPADYVNAIKEKLGTEIVRLERRRVLDAYEAVPDADAKTEAKRWIDGAVKVVEPPEEEIVKSCKLALALQNLLDEEEATLMTVDCYGSMWRKLPAYPCLSHARMGNMGLGGMCESDLRSAMTYILLQGLCGRPGFVNDPTVDESKGAIILAHCLGIPNMDGPDEPGAPYKIRTIMERQEGAVIHSRMRIGEKTTTAELIGTEQLLYFTGDIIDTPDLPRGCRTKITVKVDGDIEKLWQNWSHGLHRVTCYGDLITDLKRFCRFKEIEMVNEA